MLAALTSPHVLGAIALILTIFFLHWFYRSLKINRKYSDLYVLITGCDTGFGNRCARRLDSLGFQVFATCLTREKVVELSETCSKNVVAIKMDVTDEVAVQEALKEVKKHLPEGKGLWAIINNAGIMGPTGACEWLQKKDFEFTIRVNFLGMVSVTNAFLPLVRRSRGRVVNMASTLGRVAVVPASYCVSKFCVEAYSDSLRREMGPVGVSVHTIEPGGYATNITNASLHVESVNKLFRELSEEVRVFYGETYKKQLLNVIKMSCSLLATKNLDEVVDAYIHAITAHFPKSHYVVGLNGNLLFRPLWHLPVWLVDFLMGIFMPKPEGIYI